MLGRYALVAYALVAYALVAYALVAYALVATLWSLRFKTILADYNHTPLLTLNEADRVIQLLLIIRKEN